MGGVRMVKNWQIAGLDGADGGRERDQVVAEWQTIIEKNRE
jgi:hypothetical protein